MWLEYGWSILRIVRPVDLSTTLGLLEEDPDVARPERWSSFDQLNAATAMQGYEEGLLPQPRRGDFPAFGKSYRHLDEDQHGVAISIAAERHFALAWLNGLSEDWDSTPTDT